MKKVGILTLISLLFLGIGFTLLNRFIYEKKQGNPGSSIHSYSGTLTGEYTCLPRRQVSEPPTDECVLGIKLVSGEYYAVDTYSLQEKTLPIKQGTLITTKGIITPIQLLSTSHWDKYQIDGIFSISGSVSIIEKKYDE